MTMYPVRSLVMSLNSIFTEHLIMPGSLMYELLDSTNL